MRVAKQKDGGTKRVGVGGMLTVLRSRWICLRWQSDRHKLIEGVTRVEGIYEW